MFNSSTVLVVHIKRRHGGYLLGRSSGTYPPWYKSNPYHNIGSATVADSVGDGLQSRYIPQQAPLGISQYPSSTIYRPPLTIGEQRYGSSLSQDTIVRIQELKRLLNKYPQYHNNDPDEIVKCAIYYSTNGDNKFLDEMLERLRSIDNLAKY